MKNIFKKSKDTVKDNPSVDGGSTNNGTDPILPPVVPDTPPGLEIKKIKVDAIKIITDYNAKKTIDKIAKDLGIKKKIVEAIIYIFEQMNLTKIKKK